MSAGDACANPGMCWGERSGVPDIHSAGGGADRAMVLPSILHPDPGCDPTRHPLMMCMPEILDCNLCMHLNSTLEMG